LNPPICAVHPVFLDPTGARRRQRLCMAGNTLGQALRLTTFGESHGPAVGCVIDGCPAGVPLTAEMIQVWLDRRRPGQSPLTSPRREADQVRLLSGVYQDRTLGTPICAMVENLDTKSKDYANIQELYRPGHADFTWQARYGHRDPRGGGRASARETVGRVIGAAVAQAVLHAWCEAQGLARPVVAAWVQQIGNVALTGEFPFGGADLTQGGGTSSPHFACPDPEAAERMVAAIEAARLQRDSLGGVVRCAAWQVPVGLGDPVFDKLTGLLGHALSSLPAFRGWHIGDGFDAAGQRGSQHNDAFLRAADGSIVTATNHHGGVLGGITTGMPLRLEVAFKPVATIPQPQQGIGAEGPPQPLTVTGRHDPCVVPRAVVLVEAAVWHSLADLALRTAKLT
jgi:chorismate synthase